MNDYYEMLLSMVNGNTIDLINKIIKDYLSQLG